MIDNTKIVSQKLFFSISILSCFTLHQNDFKNRMNNQFESFLQRDKIISLSIKFVKKHLVLIVTPIEACQTFRQLSKRTRIGKSKGQMLIGTILTSMCNHLCQCIVICHLCKLPLILNLIQLYP